MRPLSLKRHPQVRLILLLVNRESECRLFIATGGGLLMRQIGSEIALSTTHVAWYGYVSLYSHHRSEDGLDARCSCEGWRHTTHLFVLAVPCVYQVVLLFP